MHAYVDKMVCEEISASSLSFKHVHALKSAVYRERCKLRPFILSTVSIITRSSAQNKCQSEACNADGNIRGRIRKSHDNTFVHFDTPRRSVGTVITVIPSFDPPPPPPCPSLLKYPLLSHSLHRSTQHKKLD